MKLAYIAPAAIALGALAATSGSAQSSTTTFKCDAPSGRFSEFKIPIQATQFRVFGTVRPMLFRSHEQLVPMGAIGLRNSATSQAMRIRFAAPNAEAEGAFATYAYDNGEGEQLGEVGTLALNNVVNFEITYVQGGQSRFTVGDQVFPISAELGSTFDMAIACSTGDFVFEQLGWQFGPPAQ